MQMYNMYQYVSISGILPRTSLAWDLFDKHITGVFGCGYDVPPV